MSEQEVPEEARRNYRTPYTDKRKIPTISKYREEQEHRQERAKAFEDRRATIDEEQDDSPQNDRLGAHGQGDSGQEEISPRGEEHDAGAGAGAGREGDDAPKDTSEASAAATDPRQRRKEHHRKRDEAAEREVTDPVTHLPVRIRDYTDDALKEVPENAEHYGSTARTATGLSAKGKKEGELEEELRELRRERARMQALFPPPEFEAVREELVGVQKTGITAGAVGVAVVAVAVMVLERVLGAGLLGRYAPEGMSGSVLSAVKWLMLGGVGAGAVVALVFGIRDWMGKKLDAVWDDEVWEANRVDQSKSSENRDAESVVWLNSLLAAVWPLVNPDLFTSLADTLEDVMQASLPKFIRMVSVEDIGQGSESIQILGVKWLPTGAAARSVTETGDLDQQNDAEGDEQNGDARQKNEETQHTKDDDQQEDGTQQPVAQGLEAEEGDFVNVEIAFAYRARSKSKDMAQRSKDSHIYLAFYLPGNIKVPVWVELRGVVGSLRMRLQLCPDPPFFSLCTLTFLGQPKVSMSCVPLSKYAVNIMDVPLISNFVQSAVDAAMAEYVAPKSLNLDLKDMLAGDDFKKDTAAHGVLVINIKRGYDFTMGDSGIPMLKEGSSDPYVSVGWAKFGKPVWSTRLLLEEMEPYWDETCYVLVTQQELNVDERIRVQLWDSDRMSADDDLGRIEVDLRELMRNQKSNGQMWHRCDGFRALKAGEDMPGKLEWSVGYYAKAGIQRCQLEKQSFDSDVRSLDQLKSKVDETCASKLREANIKKGRHANQGSEFEQQKAQEFKAREDAMIISAPPPDGYPSGIFSIQIHQITGLELGKLSKDASNGDAEASDEAEQGDGLPSAYCNVIVNHKKVFRTRTKPTNAKPFYNAGTERFVGDWRAAEVHVSVRDARVKEDDPLLGVVRLPLADVFRERAQVNGFFPLVGGVGYGRVRISMVWRSVVLQAPARALGWERGTLELAPAIASAGVPEALRGLKLKFRTSLAAGKMYATSSIADAGEEGAAGWTTLKHEHRHRHRKPQPLRLGVRMRHSSCLSIAFEDKRLLGDRVPAWAVLWLKDLPDSEATSLTLPVFDGDFARATKCCLPASECGEQVGEIAVRVTFRPGLGKAHSKWAKKDNNVRNVVEVLATARDNLEEAKSEQQAGIVGHSDGSDDEDDSGKNSSSDDSDTESADDDDAPDGDDDDDASSSRISIAGLKKQASDFKKKQESLGRRHRGIMQWRAPRTAKWGMGKVHDAEGKFKGMFKHSEHGNAGQGVETEV